MQGPFLAALLGLLRHLPAPVLRRLDGWAARSAQRRVQRRREQALARR